MDARTRHTIIIAGSISLALVFGAMLLAIVVVASRPLSPAEQQEAYVRGVRRQAAREWKEIEKEDEATAKTFTGLDAIRMDVDPRYLNYLTSKHLNKYGRLQYDKDYSDPAFVPESLRPFDKFDESQKDAWRLAFENGDIPREHMSGDMIQYEEYHVGQAE